jgi:hypothetical protein
MYSPCACHLNLIPLVFEIELNEWHLRWLSSPKGLGLQEIKGFPYSIFKRSDVKQAI